MYAFSLYSPFYFQDHAEYPRTPTESSQRVSRSFHQSVTMVNRSYEEGSQYEYIKCVVVGDAGVGKTCLICAWACGTNYNLERLVKTPSSSVWAIDHYRNDQEVKQIILTHIKWLMTSEKHTGHVLFMHDLNKQSLSKWPIGKAYFWHIIWKTFCSCNVMISFFVNIEYIQSL